MGIPFRTTAALLLFLASATVQAAQLIVYLAEGVDLKPYRSILVAPASNDTGENFEFDVAAEYTQALQTTLAEKGYAVATTRPAEGLWIELTSSVVSYEPGSAGQRWLLPGTGRTHATIRTLVRDSASGKLLADVVVSDSVAAGGLYTVGMDKRILKNFARALAEELLARQGRSEETEEASPW